MFGISFNDHISKKKVPKIFANLVTFNYYFIRCTGKDNKGRVYMYLSCLFNVPIKVSRSQSLKRIWTYFIKTCLPSDW